MQAASVGITFDCDRTRFERVADPMHIRLFHTDPISTTPRFDSAVNTEAVGAGRRQLLARTVTAAAVMALGIAFVVDYPRSLYVTLLTFLMPFLSGEPAGIAFTSGLCWGAQLLSVPLAWILGLKAWKQGSLKDALALGVLFVALSVALVLASRL